jgi:hypothetical protein
VHNGSAALVERKGCIWNPTQGSTPQSCCRRCHFGLCRNDETARRQAPSGGRPSSATRGTSRPRTRRATLYTPPLCAEDPCRPCCSASNLLATSWVNPLVAHRSNFVCASQLAQKRTHRLAPAVAAAAPRGHYMPQPLVELYGGCVVVLNVS